MTPNQIKKFMEKETERLSKITTEELMQEWDTAVERLKPYCRWYQEGRKAAHDIKAGDVVKVKNERRECIVVSVGSKEATCIDIETFIVCYKDPYALEKTGRHMDIVGYIREHLRDGKDLMVGDNL